MTPRETGVKPVGTPYKPLYIKDGKVDGGVGNHPP